MNSQEFNQAFAIESFFGIHTGVDTPLNIPKTKLNKIDFTIQNITWKDNDTSQN